MPPLKAMLSNCVNVVVELVVAPICMPPLVFFTARPLTFRLGVTVDVEPTLNM